MNIPDQGSIAAFALIADLNGFTEMVSHPDSTLVGQFTSDVLFGGIAAVQAAGGEVVAVMGDAFLGLLPDARSAFRACAAIAKDIDDQCEYISGVQETDPEAFPFAAGGPSVKIAVEYGWLETAPISSRFLGPRALVVGTAVNYAARIAAAGLGNRCVCGPKASELLSQAGYSVEGPLMVVNPKDGRQYTYFELDLSGFWVTGARERDSDSYLG